VLSSVPLRRDLDLDPNDPVVEFLEPGDLLVDVRAKLLRHAAVPGLDDNIHGDLHRYWAVPNRVNFPTHTRQSLAPAPVFAADRK